MPGPNYQESVDLKLKSLEASFADYFSQRLEKIGDSGKYGFGVIDPQVDFTAKWSKLENDNPNKPVLFSGEGKQELDQLEEYLNAPEDKKPEYDITFSTLSGNTTYTMGNSSITVDAQEQRTYRHNGEAVYRGRLCDGEDEHTIYSTVAALRALRKVIENDTSVKDKLELTFTVDAHRRGTAATATEEARMLAALKTELDNEEQAKQELAGILRLHDVELLDNQEAAAERFQEAKLKREEFAGIQKLPMHVEIGTGEHPGIQYDISIQNEITALKALGVNFVTIPKKNFPAFSGMLIDPELVDKDGNFKLASTSCKVNQYPEQIESVYPEDAVSYGQYVQKNNFAAFDFIGTVNEICVDGAAATMKQKHPGMDIQVIATGTNSIAVDIPDVVQNTRQESRNAQAKKWKRCNIPEVHFPEMPNGEYFNHFYPRTGLSPEEQMQVAKKLDADTRELSRGVDCNNETVAGRHQQQSEAKKRECMQMFKDDTLAALKDMAQVFKAHKNDWSFSTCMKATFWYNWSMVNEKCQARNQWLKDYENLFENGELKPYAKAVNMQELYQESFRIAAMKQSKYQNLRESFNARMSRGGSSYVPLEPGKFNPKTQQTFEDKGIEHKKLSRPKMS